MKDEVKQKALNFLHRAYSFLASSRVLSCSNEPSHHPLTQIYLNFLCLELIIKTLWMIEKDEKSPYTHNVYNLFTDLNDKTQKRIEDSFYSNEYRKKIFNNLRNQIRIHVNNEIPEENFIEILKRGKDVVKNLKYNQSSFSNILGGQHLDFFETLVKELLEKLQTMEK